MERLGSYDITDAVAVKQPPKEQKRQAHPVQQWQIDYVLAHADDYPRRKVAEAAKLPQQTMHNILVRHGAKMRDYQARKRRADRIVQKYWREKSYSQMAIMANVATSTIVRAVKRLGLKENPEFREAMRRRHLETIARCHEMKYQCTPEGRKRASIKRRIMVRREYERVAMGLPQRTNIRLRDLSLTARSAKIQWEMRRRGYIVDPGCPTRLLYTPETRRTRKEAHLNKKYGFIFKAKE